MNKYATTKFLRVVKGIGSVLWWSHDIAVRALRGNISYKKGRPQWNPSQGLMHLALMQSASKNWVLSSPNLSESKTNLVPLPPPNLFFSPVI